MVSLRAGAYRSLERRARDLGAGGGVFAHERHLFTFLEPAQRREVPYLLLRPFTDEEGAEAYRLRQERLPARACPVPHARLAPGLRALLRSPLHLHVFHETFQGIARPPLELDEARLFSAYLAALERELPALGETLAAVGRQLLEERRPDLPAEVADGWIEAWRAPLVRRHGGAAVAALLDPVEQLVSASVLLRPAAEGFGCDRRLVAYTFTHQALCEQVLLRELERRMAPRALPTGEEILAWARLAAGDGQRGAFAELVGALEILAARCVEAGVGEAPAALLGLEDEPARTAVLGAAIRALGPVWGQSEEGSREARVVLEALARAAKAGAGRGERLEASVWQAQRTLAQTGSSLAAQAICRLQLQVMRDLVATEPQRADLRRDLAISEWNFYLLVSSREEELTWLRAVLDTLRPLRAAGMQDAQVDQLWGLAEEALRARGEAP